MKFAAILLLAAPFLAQAQPVTTTCSDASISGVRTVTITGRQVSAAGALGQVYFAVGTVTFDGAGNVTFHLSADTNQSSNLPETWSGAYSIPSNCVGTLTITSGSMASFTLIPYANGASFSITGQDGTFTYTGTGVTPPAACVTASYSGAYTFSGNGYGLVLGTVSSSVLSGVANGVNTIAGLLQFDGAGSVHGSWSLASNGAATTATISGTYSVAAPGCVATATVTDQNDLAYTLNLAVSSANSANFDLIGATAAAPANGSVAVAFSATGHSTFTYPGLAVQNAAGISGGTPPGSLFSVYGYGIANGKAQAESTTWPTTLASAQVTVNGELAPLYYADNAALGAEGLINAQLPLDIPPGPATVVVKNGTAVSNAVAITVPAAANPGVFVYGTNHAVAQNFPSYTLNSATSPAKPNSVVIVYFTGGGAVQDATAISTGHPTPGRSFPLVSTNVNITVGGMTANYDYIGLTPTLIGVYQADIVMPAIPAGEHTLVINIDGVPSNATVVSSN